jgi:Alpha amylase, catalytic domain
MTERWYEKAIIYCLDVETFQDSNGDGVGDFAGLTRRLDYLARLGVNCLWLNPIHPSPGRDGGYSLLSWFERMMRTLRECPETNTGTCNHVDVPTPPGLLVHRADDTTGTMLFLHNLGDQEATVDVSSLDDIAKSPTEMLADRNYGDIDLDKLTVGGYGYRWICLRRGLSL